jgi:hypothetical protein
MKHVAKPAARRPSPTDVRCAEFYPTVKDLSTPELQYRFNQNRAALQSTDKRIEEITKALRESRNTHRILDEQRCVMAQILDSRR